MPLPHRGGSAQGRPGSRLAFSNAPAFNGTLNLSKQARKQWIDEDRIRAVKNSDGSARMSAELDDTELGRQACVNLLQREEIRRGVSALKHQHEV